MTISHKLIAITNTMAPNLEDEDSIIIDGGPKYFEPTIFKIRGRKKWPVQNSPANQKRRKRKEQGSTGPGVPIATTSTLLQNPIKN